jgi:hypothetical protein
MFIRQSGGAVFCFWGTKYYVSGLRHKRTDQIRIFLNLAANSITDAFKIYDCTRGRVVKLVSREVRSRLIDLKLPIPFGPPEVR